MNYFDKPRFLLIMVFVLVLINLATLSFVWLRRPPMMQGGPPGRRGENAGEFLVEKIGFSAEQRDAFEQMRDQHRQAARETEDSLRFYKKQLFGNLPGGDAAAADLAANNIGRLQRKLEMNTFTHFVAVRKLCSPEQAEKFDAIIDDVLRMMAPPQGPPGGRIGNR